VTSHAQPARTRGGVPAASASALILNGSALAAAAADLRAVDVVSCRVDQLVFRIEPDDVAVTETVTNRKLHDFRLVQVASYPRPTASVVTAIADYVRHHGILGVNIDGIGAPTKLSQYVRLAYAGLPVPATLYADSSWLTDSYDDIVQRFDRPFILKALSASGGRHNYLVSDEREFRQHLNEEASTHVHLLAQEFIPNDVTYRLLVMGADVKLALRRSWAPGSHLSNTEQGGASVLVEPAELSPSVCRLAIECAAVLDYEIAGVNLIQHWTTGSWHVLDVNATPAITTGAFVEEKIAAYRAYLVHCLSFDFSLA